MKHIFNNILAVALLATVFVSCNGLDELPDNRTMMDSPEKLTSLMTSAYPQSSHAVLCEYSGDNMLDDNVVVPSTHNSAYDKWMDEMYEWRDVENYSVNSDDTPYQVWDSYYKSISVCNHAIAAMEEISDNPAADPDLAPIWGEAHILRAYCHFILVGLFSEAYKDDATSVNDRGIPYVTKVEDVVHVDYNQNFTHNVKETYDLIEKDLLEGLPYINDNIYKVKAFRFNKKAANAFAARFFLFKKDYQNAKKYADIVLGDNPSSVMRRWTAMNMNTAYTKRDSYWDVMASCNLLIQSTYSLQWRYHTQVARHAINEPGKEAKTVEINGAKHHMPDPLSVCLYGSGPNWTGALPCYSGLVYVNSSGQEYGCYHMKLIEFFEYTDKIAGIGYVHMLYLPFSTEETLLCRAEAKLYLGDKAGALQDLNIWTSSKSSASREMNELTEAKIIDFYSNPKNEDYNPEYHPEHMGYQKVFAPESAEKYILDAILHFRRIETVHNGDRWFDIKRYGIKVKHFFRGPNETDIHVDSLMWDDPRRVLQLPASVKDAGYETNRPTSGSAGGGAGFGYQTSAPYKPALTPIK